MSIPNPIAKAKAIELKIPQFPVPYPAAGPFPHSHSAANPCYFPPMKSLLFTPKRYQLKKDVARVVRLGHPWIFRTHVSSAADTFENGQWLRLVDAENVILGYGIFEKEGLIAIRVLKQGKTPPDSEWFGKKLETALGKREKLRTFTNSFRALHGENDGLPGVVLDIYDTTGS